MFLVIKFVRVLSFPSIHSLDAHAFTHLIPIPIPIPCSYTATNGNCAPLLLLCEISETCWWTFCTCWPIPIKEIHDNEFHDNHHLYSNHRARCALKIQPTAQFKIQSHSTSPYSPYSIFGCDYFQLNLSDGSFPMRVWSRRPFQVKMKMRSQQQPTEKQKQKLN